VLQEAAFQTSLDLRSDSVRSCIPLRDYGALFSGQGDFYTQQEYKEFADRYEQLWFERHPELREQLQADPTTGKDPDAARLVEDAYWCFLSVRLSVRVEPARLA
jgi:hypothetical protein